MPKLRLFLPLIFSLLFSVCAPADSDTKVKKPDPALNSSPLIAQVAQVAKAAKANTNLKAEPAYELPGFEIDKTKNRKSIDFSISLKPISNTDMAFSDYANRNLVVFFFSIGGFLRLHMVLSFVRI